MHSPANSKRDWNRIAAPLLLGLVAVLLGLVAFAMMRPDASPENAARSAELARQMDAAQAQGRTAAEARARANQDAMR